MKNPRKFLVSLLAGLMAAIMVLSLLLSIFPTRARAEKSSSEIQEEIDALKEKQDELKDQMEELLSQQQSNLDDIASAMDQKNNLDHQITLLFGQIENLNTQIQAYTQLIADKQDDYDLSMEQLNELSRRNKERIRAMEEDGPLSYWSVLFKARSFSDLLDRISMVQEIAASDRRRMAEMETAAQVVEQNRQELTDQKAELECKRQELDDAQLALAEKRSQADALLQELTDKGMDMQQMMVLYENKEAELLEELAAAEDEYDAAKQAEWEAAHPPAPPSTGGSGGGGGSAPSSSGWIVPCSYYYVSSPFGPREAPCEGASTFHAGVDLAGAYGTPIYASRSGYVHRGGYNDYNGNFIGIDHGDGFSSVYLHMSYYVVSIGDYVQQGQVIGYMGNSGIGTGTHLHFTIYYNGTAVNPANYIDI